MALRDPLPLWVNRVPKEPGGSGTIGDVARIIWRDHEADLKSGRDFFYTWQYCVRWAASKLRRSGEIKAVELSPRGVW